MSTTKTEPVHLEGGVFADFTIESAEDKEEASVTIWLPTPTTVVDVEAVIGRVCDAVVPGLKRRPQGVAGLPLKHVHIKWAAPPDEIHRLDGLFQTRLFAGP